MSEYYMKYEDICSEVDKYLGNHIKSNPDSSYLKVYEPEIIAALIGDYEKFDYSTLGENVSLWKNLIQHSEQVRIYNRYIPVKSTLLTFLKEMIDNCVLDNIINVLTSGSSAGFSISISATIVIAIWAIINSAKKLEDCDFCVYMQAVTHFKDKSNFSLDDLKQWFPHGESRICNMHNDTWSCSHYNSTNDTCKMLEDDRLQKALESLMKKDILEPYGISNEYKFKI